MPAVPVTRNRIVELLRRQDRGLTVGQVAVLLQMNEHTVRGSMNAARYLKGDQRVLYVSRWIRNLGTSGKMTPVFRAGRLPDAAKPEVKVRKESWTRYNTRKYVQEKQEKAIERIKKTSDPWEKMLLAVTHTLTPIERPSVGTKRHLSWSTD
jgi:predicted Zn-ribbon and HTH transcriptional regulator